MASYAILDGLDSMDANHHLKIVAFSILLYDYCLTFVAEVERCWVVRRFSWGLGFFYLNRYLALFGHIPIMMEYFWTTSNSNKVEICYYLESFHVYLVIIIQVVVACILIIRMYALYERSRKVLALYIIVGVVMLAVDCWVALSAKDEKSWKIHIPIGCDSAFNREAGIHFGIAWTGLLVFDLLVFGMTLYKSIVLPRPNRGNILDIFLRDGAIYFGVMTACHLATILTFTLGGAGTRAVAATLANVISSVMISRFMLNLRDPSLLSSGRRTSFRTSPAELTYPITTIAEVEHPTQISEGPPYQGLAPSPPGRSHTMNH